MRVFLLSVLAVIVVATGAWAILERQLRENAGDAFALPRSVRITAAEKPRPSGQLSGITDRQKQEVAR